MLSKSALTQTFDKEIHVKNPQTGIHEKLLKLFFKEMRTQKILVPAVSLAVRIPHNYSLPHQNTELPMGQNVYPSLTSYTFTGNVENAAEPI